MKKFLLTIFLIFFACSAIANANTVFSEKNKFGLKSDNGEILVKPIYNKMIRIGDNSYLVQNKRHKFGIIDKDGKIILEPKYSHAERILGEYLLIGNYGRYGLYDQYGKNVIPNEYDSISLLFGRMLLTYKDYHCGVMDFNGNVILKNIFDDIYMPSANVMRIKYEGNWYEIEQVNADKLKSAQIAHDNGEKVDFQLFDIVETPVVVSGYSVVTFSDYLIKMLSSISPAHEQTIDDLMFSQGADTVNIIIKCSWIPKYPFTYAKNYFRTVKNPYNGPFAGVKTKLKKHIK